MTTPKLSDRELDAVIAEKVYGEQAFRRPSMYHDERPIPPYSSSLDALAPVVKKTIEKCGATAIVEQLIQIRSRDVDTGKAEELYVLLLTASPRQIAEAIVRCWE